jgi:hypothetical protein
MNVIRGFSKPCMNSQCRGDYHVLSVVAQVSAYVSFINNEPDLSLIHSSSPPQIALNFRRLRRLIQQPCSDLPTNDTHCRAASHNAYRAPARRIAGDQPPSADSLGLCVRQALRYVRPKRSLMPDDPFPAMCLLKRYHTLPI